MLFETFSSTPLPGETNIHVAISESTHRRIFDNGLPPNQLNRHSLASVHATPFVSGSRHVLSFVSDHEYYFIGVFTNEFHRRRIRTVPVQFGCVLIGPPRRLKER